MDPRNLARMAAGAVSEAMGRELTPQLRDSLSVFKAPSLRRAIPREDEQRLIDLGYLRQALGGLVLTDKGNIAVHLL